MSERLSEITCLFVDIGGVLLSDGWGHEFRQRAAAEFDIDYEEMDVRHRQAFEAYEVNKLSLQDYLERVVFFRDRPFTQVQFQNFMFDLSTPFPEMIDLIRRLKSAHALKVVVLSNEAREMNLRRIEKFKLGQFVDTFVSSSFVGLRKPDPDIFRLALDISQIEPEKVLYIENTPMFTEVAADFGIKSILHTDYSSTRQAIASFGLELTHG